MEKFLWDATGVVLFFTSLMLLLLAAALQNVPAALCVLGIAIVDLVYVKARPTWVKC